MLPVDLVHPHCLLLYTLAVVVPILALWRLSDRLSASSQKSVPVTENPPDVLPGWWSDAAVFQLEIRAIFSQTWLCISHRSRFVKAGDYISQDLAGFRLFMILGKDGVVRTFHNVCRHRAYPVAKKASGSATVLGCQYHGWSYNTLGELTKAPQFDQVDGFNKADNGLFPIHTRTDAHGFVHINLRGCPEAELDALPVPENASHVSFQGTSHLVHSYQWRGNFNWKVAVLHDHADSQAAVHRAALAVLPTTNFFVRLLRACGLVSSSARQVRFFPLTTVHSQTGCPIWYQLTYSPDEAGQTTVRCDVYADKSSIWTSEMETQFEMKLQDLIKIYENAYVQLTESNGSKSVVTAAGALRDHAQLASLVKTHRKTEHVKGREIHPAAVQQCRSAAFSKAESICQAISYAGSKLEW